jgi:hypothetical protein
MKNAVVIKGKDAAKDILTNDHTGDIQCSSYEHSI